MIPLFSGEREKLVGEDTAYLFEAIEELFGVSLGDWQAHLGTTCAELTDFIVQFRQEITSAPPQRSFFELVPEPRILIR